MRDKRRRGPSSQGPDEPESKLDRLDHARNPWAAASAANDNAWRDDEVIPLDEADAIPEFGDEATTLYRRQLAPERSAKPARRPSARYRAQPNSAPRRSEAPSSDEPFGIEGSLPRSLRPGQPRGRNTGVVLAGFLAIGLAALWTARGPAWSRAMLSVSSHNTSIASAPISLGHGHLVDRAEATSTASAGPTPTHRPDIELDTPLPSTEQTRLREVMEFELAEVPNEPDVTQTEPQKHKKRSHRAVSHGHKNKVKHVKHRAVGRPIQHLAEQDDERQEPFYYRAAVNEGTLQVNSRPWARVLVDGRFMGHTPQRALRLPAGRHRVQLVNEQLDMSKLFEVVITPGDIVTRVEILDENAHTSR